MGRNGCIFTDATRVTIVFVYVVLGVCVFGVGWGIILMNIALKGMYSTVVNGKTLMSALKCTNTVSVGSSTVLNMMKTM